MTNKERIEGNVLIAKFLGYEEGFSHYEDEHGYHQCVEGFDIPDKINYDPHKDDKDDHQFRFDQLEFYGLWDWLIPACYKWDNLNLTSIEYSIHSDMLDIAVSCYEIIPVFEQLVKNIKWYNKQANDKS